MPSLLRLHIKGSKPSFRLIEVTRAMMGCHSINLFPTKDVLKEAFIGLKLSISITIACFLLTILNNEGYWYSNSRYLIISSQNLIYWPLCNLKLPRFRKGSFTPTSLEQKYESPALLLTSLKVIVLRYLFRNKFCHMPSSLHKLKKSYLLKIHLFSMSKLCIIPSPLCSLAWHQMSHLTKQYLFLY